MTTSLWPKPCAKKYGDLINQLSIVNKVRLHLRGSGTRLHPRLCACAQQPSQHCSLQLWPGHRAAAVVVPAPHPVVHHSAAAGLRAAAWLRVPPVHIRRRPDAAKAVSTSLRPGSTCLRCMSGQHLLGHKYSQGMALQQKKQSLLHVSSCGLTPPVATTVAGTLRWGCCASYWPRRRGTGQSGSSGWMPTPSSRQGSNCPANVVCMMSQMSC